MEVLFHVGDERGWRAEKNILVDSLPEPRKNLGLSLKTALHGMPPGATARDVHLPEDGGPVTCSFEVVSGSFDNMVANFGWMKLQPTS